MDDPTVSGKKSRCSVEVRMMAHDRAGWWWQQEGYHWDPRGKKGQASVG